MADGDPTIAALRALARWHRGRAANPVPAYEGEEWHLAAANLTEGVAELMQSLRDEIVRKLGEQSNEQL